MAHIEDRWRSGGDRSRLRYRARYIAPDGRQRSRSFERKTDARRWLDQQQAGTVTGAWIDPRHGRRRFTEWADRWWQLWSTKPGRSPTTLMATESHLRIHVRPAFDHLPLEAITPHVILAWQQELAGRAGHELVMACRSILYRILATAEDERAIPSNPVRKVPAPERSIDPEAIFGRVKPRVFTPEQLGRFLAAAWPSHREHFLILARTGLRAGEFCGLRTRRVDLAAGYLEVLDTRYEAGRWGTGYKDRPKSTAGIRRVPLAPIVTEAIGRQLPADLDPTALAFTGPGGGPGVKRGKRSALSMTNLRRAYKAALVERIGGTWDRPITKPRFPNLDLHGPHDLRHTFATRLEDAGIPARVIDEVMGHSDHRAARAGSSIGGRYRHTTPDTERRIRAAIQERLTVAWFAAGFPVESGQLSTAPARRPTAPRRPRHAKRAAS